MPSKKIPIKGTLSRKEVLQVSRALKAQGLKLPHVGICRIFKTPISDAYGRLRPEICKDRHGYYFVGDKGYARK